MNHKFITNARYNVNGKIEKDKNAGLYRDESSNYFVTIRSNGEYNTFAIDECDVDKWFFYFGSNILVENDDGDLCDTCTAQKLLAVESNMYDIEALFYDGKKFFISYMNTKYQASKICSKEEAKIWVENQKNIDGIIYFGSYAEALEFINSI